MIHNVPWSLRTPPRECFESQLGIYFSFFNLGWFWNLRHFYIRKKSMVWEKEREHWKYWIEGSDLVPFNHKVKDTELSSTFFQVTMKKKKITRHWEENWGPENKYENMLITRWAILNDSKIPSKLYCGPQYKHFASCQLTENKPWIDNSI